MSDETADAVALCRATVRDVVHLVRLNLLRGHERRTLLDALDAVSRRDAFDWVSVTSKARAERAERERDGLDAQIGRLARTIMEEVPGEPSEDEGAVDCAIRLLRDRNQLLERLEEAHLARIEAQNPGIDIKRVREQRAEQGPS